MLVRFKYDIISKKTTLLNVFLFALWLLCNQISTKDYLLRRSQPRYLKCTKWQKNLLKEGKKVICDIVVGQCHPSDIRN